MTRLAIGLLCVAGVLTSAPAGAQSEQELRRVLEGQYVIVKMDLPATQYGLDVYPLREQSIDFRTYSDRIREYGVALREGTRVMVTTVRVKKKNVELQLGGGGYGVFGDDSGSVYVASVPKSNREKDLEKWVKDERDPDRRRRMQRELDDLRRDREREQRDRDSEKRDLEERKKSEIADKRLRAGSRVNLWYSDGTMSDPVPTVAQMRRMLAKVIDFSPVQGLRAESPTRPVTVPVSRVAPKAPAPPRGGDLRRGMTKDEVHRVLGQPRESTPGKQGDLATLTEVFDGTDTVTEVVFVADVVVKFTTSSK
jgi:hypothetical protein